jgi:hypothetical protein
LLKGEKMTRIVSVTDVATGVAAGRKFDPIAGSAEVIYGIPWYAAVEARTGRRLGDDYALCGRCWQLCDVGAELRHHAAAHRGEDLDP